MTHGRRVGCLAGLGLLIASGCTYSIARLDYAQHPELQNVRLWTSKRDVTPGTLGLVEASRGGWFGCDDMATQTTLDLLQDARLMGGKGVIATRYMNPAHWAGRPRCRRNWVFLGHMTVQAMGYAVKQIPSDGMASAPVATR